MIEPSILTKSGNYFYFLYPERSSYDISDIAHGLSNICRFGGHCNEFYSVAQHSVLASQYVEKKHAYDALMHDTPEAFIGDITKPLKILLPDYQKIEKNIEREIFLKFKVSNPLPPEVKHIDLVMLATEQNSLMAKPIVGGVWRILEGVRPIDVVIEPWAPKEAYCRFMNRYEELINGI